MTVLSDSFTTPTWTFDDLIEILQKLSAVDLVRFLSPHFPEERLEDWDHPTLLELALNLLQSWSEEFSSPDEFLVKATSSLCRASFEAFVRLLWDEVPGSRPLLWNWHLSVLCQAAQETAEAIFRGERPPDLIINIAPGSSKSTIFSRLLPCWIWTRMPEAGIITASHTEYLVLDLAVHSRDVMRGPMYRLLFPEIDFMENQDAKGHYRNTKGGERFTCTIGGKSPIGKHCNFAIIDDPLNPEDVFSEAARKMAANFVTQHIVTRRQRGAYADPFVRILVMQRIGMGDPTDATLEVSRVEGAAPVRKICIPAELTDDVEPKELRKYYDGINADGGCATDGLFDPVRFSRRALNELRASMGEWVYASQLLQSPRPLAGGLFKIDWFSDRVLAAPLRCKRIRYWDRGGSKSETACYTAGVLIAFAQDKFYIEDVVHGKWEPDERNAVMRATAMRDRARYGKYEPQIYVEAEGGSSGRDAWLGIVRALMGFSVKEDRVQGSKDTRAEPWATQLSARNVCVVDNGESQGLGPAGWDINGYIQEHLAFKPEPGVTKLGRLKDRVDASTGAFNLLVKLKRPYLPLYTYVLTPSKNNQGKWIVACSLEELSLLDIGDHRALVVVFSDPPSLNPIPIMGSVDLTEPCPGKGMGVAGCETSSSALRGVEEMPVDLRESDRGLLPPSFPKYMDRLDLTFADLDPADYQVNHGSPIEPWKKPITELQMSREQSKRFWVCLSKKHEKPWDALIIVDQGGEDRRALSAAMAVADMLRIPRSAIFIPGYSNREELIEEEPPNQWVFEEIKTARHQVMVA